MPFDPLHQIDSVAFHPDSAKVALTNIAQEIATNPNQFLQDLIHDAIAFGIKVLAAIVIYAIGAWLIKRVKNILHMDFERKHTGKDIVIIRYEHGDDYIDSAAFHHNHRNIGHQYHLHRGAARCRRYGNRYGAQWDGAEFRRRSYDIVFKPFKAGDYIEALGFSGIVNEVNIVSTKLRTFDNKTIILPNGALSNGNIKNYFERKVNRLEWTVNLDYSTDNAKAKEAMMNLLKSDKRILDSATPGASNPFVALNSMKDSSVEYVMKGWVNTEDYWDVMYDMNEAIFTELPKQGLSFPFPQMDIHMK